mmetsp:Transcript_62/g.108  ORF Transcript_62/g.108 Transcript_62/m.108 type:complete len:201 (+) Transcript_62:1557-2159(+)
MARVQEGEQPEPTCPMRRANEWRHAMPCWREEASWQALAMVMSCGAPTKSGSSASILPLPCCGPPSGARTTAIRLSGTASLPARTSRAQAPLKCTATCTGSPPASALSSTGFTVFQAPVSAATASTTSGQLPGRHAAASGSQGSDETMAVVSETASRPAWCRAAHSSSAAALASPKATISSCIRRAWLPDGGARLRRPDC